MKDCFANTKNNYEQIDRFGLLFSGPRPILQR